MWEQPAAVLVGVLRPGRADCPVEVLEPVLVPLPVVVLHPDVPAVVQRVGVSCAGPPKCQAIRDEVALYAEHAQVEALSPLSPLY